MNRILAVIICVFWVQGIIAQNLYTREFGKVTQHEMTMESYDKDPEAEAVVLYNIGDTRFTRSAADDLVLNMSVCTKIKIINQAGLKYAEIEIPLYSSGNDIESLIELEATTFNYENGQLIKSVLEKKNIYEKRNNQHWISKTFAMPNVKEGSVIEIKYTIQSSFFFNLREWYFQQSIPVVYSAYKIKMIPYYEYAYSAKGISKFDEYEEELLSNEVTWGNLKYKEMQFVMGLNDVPAFKDIEFITSPQDHIISARFQLARINYPRGGKKEIMSTWPALCNEFLKDNDFGKYISSAEKEAKNILPTLNINGKGQKEIIKILSNYVKYNYNWNGFSDKFARKKVSDTMKEKTGNSAELNLLLLGLLKKAGINVKPLLLSTREHGTINKAYPFQQYLNYVVVLAETEEDIYLLDATESMLSFEEIPSRCVNIDALVVEKDSEKWVTILQDLPALTEKEFTINCNENSSLVEAGVTYTASNYDAYQYRKTYHGETQNLKNLLQERKVDVVGDIQLISYTDLEQPFSFSFNATSKIENVDNKLFIHPFINQAPVDNLFTKPSRTLPIDMIHIHAGIYKSHIQIPEGYKIESLPKEVTSNNKFIKIVYKTEIEGNTIHINAEYEFQKTIYSGEEYASLKYCYDELTKRFNELIVLSKI